MVLGGLCLVAFYGIARRYSIGSLGAETDIGGGLIPLLGLVLIIVGVAMIAARARR